MNWNGFDPLKYILPKMTERTNMTNGIDSYVQGILSQYLGGLTQEEDQTPPSNEQQSSFNTQQQGSPNPHTTSGAGTEPAPLINPNQINRSGTAPSPLPIEEQEYKPTYPRSRVIEIHGFIIIQIHIPKHIDINDLNVEHDATKVIVSGFPSGEPLEIKLPDLVRKKAGKAIYKKNILEIRLVKYEDDTMHPLPIRRK